MSVRCLEPRPRNCPVLEPMADPVVIMAASTPELPPKPIDRPVVMNLEYIRRKLIRDPLFLIDSMTWRVPLKLTVLYKLFRLRNTHPRQPTLAMPNNRIPAQTPTAVSTPPPTT